MAAHVSDAGAESGLSSDSLAAFLPAWLAARTGSAAKLRPDATPVPAIVVFADVSGFSRLTRVFQDQGDRGVEKFTLIISDYIGRLIDAVHVWGGQVENIYGDAILAFWPAPEGEWDAAASRALACAADIVGDLDNYEAAEGLKLRIRAAAVAGDLTAVQAGGVGGHWHFLLAGDCLGEVPDLIRAAAAGQVAVAASMRTRLAPLPALASPKQLRDLGMCRPPPGLQPCAPPHGAELRAFLPAALSRRDPTQQAWLAEFRFLAVLCVGMPGLACRGSADLAALQAAVTSVQEIVERFGGSVVRISMSDKGPMALIAFGLPDFAHEDDPVRAVRGGQAIEAALDAQRVSPRWTVAFGLAYCGIVGNARRRVYATMGDAVNRAAKLLDRAGLPSAVCDEATLARIRHTIDCEVLPAGLGDAAALFRPLPGSRPRTPVATAIAGREAELAWLRDRAAALHPGRAAPVVFIDGDAGAGKSSLIDAFLAGLAGHLVLRGAAESMSGATLPFAAFAGVFAALLPAEAVDARLQEEWVRAALRRQARPPDDAPFAAAVLPLLRPLQGGVPDLTPEDTARVTRETLCALLRDRLADGTAVIIVDDVHDMDSASWSLAAQIARDVPGSLLVLVSRCDPASPGGQPAPLDVLAAAVQVERRRLGRLDADALRAILAATLDCGDIALDLFNAIEARAAGNPLFARQLALALRDQGAVSVLHGTARLAAASSDAAAPVLPDSIQRAIAARVDRLPAQQQIVLKAASVIGTGFTQRALFACLEVPQGDAAGPAGEAAGQSLARLAGRGLVTLLRGGSNAAYGFDHALTQEAVYQLLTFEQRRRLHCAAASFFEAEPAEAQPAPGVLGLHWSRAELPARALPYWERAGAAALAGGAYRESARALREALAACHAAGLSTAEPARVANLHATLGEALLQCGEIDDCITQLTRALRGMDVAWVDRPAGGLRTFVRGAAGQIVQRRRIARSGEILPLAPAGPAAQAERLRLQRAALTLETLGQALSHKSRYAAAAIATLTALNLAQRAADSTIYSRCAGLMALVLLLGRMPGLAKTYGADARATLPSASTPRDRLMAMEYLSMFLMSAGRLAEAATELREMMSLAAASSNRRRLLDATSLLTLTLMDQGDIAAAWTLACQFEAETDQLADLQLRCWSRLEGAELAVLRGDAAAAERRVDDAKACAQTSLSETIWAHGVGALVQLRLGREALALDEARAMAALAAPRKLLASYAMRGAFCGAEVFLHFLQAGPSAALRREGETALGKIAGLGAKRPLTQSRSTLLLAECAAARRDDAKAARLARRAVAEAAAIDSPAARRDASAALARLAR